MRTVKREAAILQLPLHATHNYQSLLRLPMQACDSPLVVAAAAGAMALPQLLKLAKVGSVFGSAGGTSPLATSDSMPIELELGAEFNFHSIFACPVSKEMTDKDNPPMLMICGHVLARKSIESIASQKHSRFKCPYCPEETEQRFCKELHFPDPP